MLTEKEVLISSVSFMLLFGINPKVNPLAKIELKHFTRQIKKQLAMYRRVSPTRYLELVNQSSSILSEVRSMMTLRDQKDVNKISPGDYMELFRKEMSELYIKYDINERHYSNLILHTSGNGLKFPTIMYMNRLLKVIEGHMTTQQEAA